MTTHQQILERLAVKWIDMGGGRRSLAKRKLPPQAYDSSPNVVVKALTSEEKADEVCGHFRSKHWNSRFDEAHVPMALAWHVIAPTGETFFIYIWGNWRSNSATLFREYCVEAGREVGELSADGTIDLGSRTISFFDCTLIHEDEIQPGLPRKEKSKAGQDCIAAARRLLRGKKNACEEIEERTFSHDKEAHDDELQERLEQSFAKKLKSFRKKLSTVFQEPTETGTDNHCDIPLNGILEYAIWKVSGKSLYLATVHEDRELPWLIVLGVSK
jgi:hypothetical protein